MGRRGQAAADGSGGGGLRGLLRMSCVPQGPPAACCEQDPAAPGGPEPPNQLGVRSVEAAPEGEPRRAPASSGGGAVGLPLEATLGLEAPEQQHS